MCVARLFPRLVGERRALFPARGLSKVWLLVDVPNQHMHVSEHQPRMLAAPLAYNHKPHASRRQPCCAPAAAAAGAMGAPPPQPLVRP